VQRMQYMRDQRTRVQVQDAQGEQLGLAGVEEDDAVDVTQQQSRSRELTAHWLHISNAVVDSVDCGITSAWEVRARMHAQHALPVDCGMCAQHELPVDCGMCAQHELRPHCRMHQQRGGYRRRKRSRGRAPRSGTGGCHCRATARLALTTCGRSTRPRSAAKGAAMACTM
jgi:hypothetical protein